MRPVSVEKGKTGSSSSSVDNICGLIVNGPAVEPSATAAGVVNGTIYPLTKPSDAEALGLTAAYDKANNVRVFRHISEFYRMAGTGKKLYIAVGAPGKTMKNLIEELGQPLIVASKGSAFYVGVAFNPATGYTPTVVDGIEDKVREAIAPAQALHEWSWNTDRPVNVFLEGRGLSASGATALDLRNISAGADVLRATHVSLCIGQDWDYAETQDAIGKKFADVGTLLGTKASISVNRNVGEVETLVISDAVRGVWLNGGLSSHKKLDEVDADLSDYDSKGYIFGVSYTGVSGIRWNGDHVCSESKVDDDGFISISTIGHGATVNKASRLIRAKLLPKIKATVPMDSATGKLPVGVVKYFEGIADQAFERMAKDGEVSNGATHVNPESNLFSGEKALEVSFTVVPTATIEKIKGVINLKTTV